MKIDLKLDEECWSCEGAGKRTSTNNCQGIYEDSRCINCRGNGYILTDDGKELVDFLARNRVLG